VLVGCEQAHGTMHEPQLTGHRTRDVGLGQMLSKGHDPLTRDAGAHSLYHHVRLGMGQEPEPTPVGVLRRGPGAVHKVSAGTRLLVSLFAFGSPACVWELILTAFELLDGSGWLVTADQRRMGTRGHRIDLLTTAFPSHSKARWSPRLSLRSFRDELLMVSPQCLYARLTPAGTGIGEIPSIARYPLPKANRFSPPLPSQFLHRGR
jgi:hypothetical protein